LGEKITVKSIYHNLIGCPVKFPVDNMKDFIPDGNEIALKDGDGKLTPVQTTTIDGKKYIVFIISLKKGEEKYFEPVNASAGNSKVALINKPDSKCMEIILDGKIFTSYVYDDKFAKPYLGPVYNRAGDSFTRLDFETKEHPHQRSVFLGISNSHFGLSVGYRDSAKLSASPSMISESTN
jgi:hypothetical protein